MTGFCSMRCVRVSAAAAVFTAALGASSIASAVGFSGSYQVNALSADPGLVIQTAELADPLNFVLNAPGDMHMVDLFDIWTDETSANFGDDFDAAGVSVDFTFTAPPSLGSVTGTTMAGTIIVASGGVLTWDGPTDIGFGNGGVMRVSLTDAIFNVGGGLNLTPGREHGATVKATFEMVSESVPQVPLPASLPLLVAALGGLMALRRRSALAA